MRRILRVAACAVGTLLASLPLWRADLALADDPPAHSAPVFLSPAEIDEIAKGSACRNLVRQFFKLQRDMATTGLITEFYDLSIIESDEVIQGQKGRYYSVFLKDAVKSARFQFPGGRYVIDDFELRFRQSLTAFVREVLAVVEGAADYEIYVHGSSSATPMSVQREMVKDHKYSSIAFLPSIGKDKYEAHASKTHDVPVAYRNEDLPYLRAAFLQNVVARFFPLKKPFVLQSDVSSKASEQDQFAELLLFVDW